jgi:hypothetical protein
VQPSIVRGVDTAAKKVSLAVILFRIALLSHQTCIFVLSFPSKTVKKMSVPTTPVRAKREIKKKVYSMYDSEDEDFGSVEDSEVEEKGAKANASAKVTKKRKHADSDDEEFAVPEEIVDDVYEDDDFEAHGVAEAAVESEDDFPEARSPAKRAKTATGRAGAPSKTKLSKKLKGLKREELIELVESLVESHPELCVPFLVLLTVVSSFLEFFALSRLR